MSSLHDRFGVNLVIHSAQWTRPLDPNLRTCSTLICSSESCQQQTSAPIRWHDFCLRGIQRMC
jgi:hypothetical protein